MGGLPGGMAADVWTSGEELPASADEVQFIVLPFGTPPSRLSLLAKLPRLRVIQLMSADAEHVLNHKDKAAAIAHFAPAAAYMMAWASEWQPSAWATFTALRCRQVSRRATTAVVYCTFTESQAPSVGNPDNFWTVELHRQSAGRWLITNFG
jgi:hypothetical protein